MCIFSVCVTDICMADDFSSYNLGGFKHVRCAAMWDYPYDSCGLTVSANIYF